MLQVKGLLQRLIDQNRLDRYIARDKLNSLFLSEKCQLAFAIGKNELRLECYIIQVYRWISDVLLDIRLNAFPDLARNPKFFNLLNSCKSNADILVIFLADIL